MALICAATATTKTPVKMAVAVKYPSCMDMDRASPPVSPSVVAAILITQKSKVTSGTLLRAVSSVSFMVWDLRCT